MLLKNKYVEQDFGIFHNLLFDPPKNEAVFYFGLYFKTRWAFYLRGMILCITHGGLGMRPFAPTATGSTPTAAMGARRGSGGSPMMRVAESLSLTDRSLDQIPLRFRLSVFGGTARGVGVEPLWKPLCPNISAQLYRKWA